MARILIVDDEPVIVKVLSQRLMVEGYEVVGLSDGNAAVELLHSDNGFDLLISDIRMSPIDGMELLKLAHAKRPLMPVIMMTGYATTGTASEALSLNVFDYIRKPFKIDDLLLTVERAIQYRRSLAAEVIDTAQLASKHGGPPGMVVASDPMKHITEVLNSMAPTHTNVLLAGEYGSGRTAIARAIHEMSPRAGKDFIVLPCAELPEPVLKDELLGGHLGGVATKGIMAQPRTGTIFLRDVCALPMGIQVLILEYLRRNKGTSGFEPPRFVSGTAGELSDLVAAGEFDPDLAAVLSQVSIVIPPLRERKDDILPIACSLMKKHTKPGAPPPRISAAVQKIFNNYTWPGNAAEMERVVEIALSSSKGDTIDKQDLPEYLAQTGKAEGSSPKSWAPNQGIALKQFLREKLTTPKT